MSDHWTSVVVMSVIDCLNQFAALWEHVFRDEKVKFLLNADHLNVARCVTDF